VSESTRDRTNESDRAESLDGAVGTAGPAAQRAATGHRDGGDGAGTGGPTGVDSRGPTPAHRSGDGSHHPLAAAFEDFLRHVREHGRALPLREWLDLAEAWRIEQALRENRGNRSAAARALGIGRRTLYAKMHKLGL